MNDFLTTMLTKVRKIIAQDDRKAKVALIMYLSKLFDEWKKNEAFADAEIEAEVKTHEKKYKKK